MARKTEGVNIFGETRDDVVARLQKNNATLVSALEWFANPDHWQEEQLSNGSYFSAEWRAGFDPRDFARIAIDKAMKS